MIFFDKTNFGFKINENVVAYSYNSYFKDQEDILIIYDKSSEDRNYIEGYLFPIGINGLALMHNKILMGLCKKDGQNDIFYFILKKSEILIGILKKCLIILKLFLSIHY